MTDLRSRIPNKEYFSPAFQWLVETFWKGPTFHYVYTSGRKNDNDLINLMSGKSYMAKDDSNRYMSGVVFVFSYQLHCTEEMSSKSLR